MNYDRRIVRGALISEADMQETSLSFAKVLQNMRLTSRYKRMKAQELLERTE
jgi:hypothetical protein